LGYTTSYFNQEGQLVAKAIQGNYRFTRKDEKDIVR
jgi:hypothetical protein